MTGLRASLFILINILIGNQFCFSYFRVNNDNRQGEILSPMLFSFYVDDLSLALSSIKTGCIISDISVNYVFFMLMTFVSCLRALLVYNTM